MNLIRAGFAAVFAAPSVTRKGDALVREVQALGGGGSGWRARSWSVPFRNGIGSDKAFKQEPRIAEAGAAGAFTQIMI